MRIVAGRAFDPVRHDGRQEALIDRRLAEQFFPTGNPIGAKIPRPGTRISTSYEPKPADGLTIVGVVEQARLYDVHQDGRPQLYIRAEDWGFRPLSFVVRTARRSRVAHPGGARGAAAGRLARRDGRRADDGGDRGRSAAASSARARW